MFALHTCPDRHTTWMAVSLSGVQWWTIFSHLSGCICVTWPTHSHFTVTIICISYFCRVAIIKLSASIQGGTEGYVRLIPTNMTTFITFYVVESRELLRSSATSAVNISYLSYDSWSKNWRFKLVWRCQKGTSFGVKFLHIFEHWMVNKLLIIISYDSWSSSRNASAVESINVQCSVKAPLNVDMRDIGIFFSYCGTTMVVHSVGVGNRVERVLCHEKFCFLFYEMLYTSNNDCKFEYDLFHWRQKKTKMGINRYTNSLHPL